MTIEPIFEKLELSDPPVLAKGYVTFGMFNRISKISDEAATLWARILHAVPNSRLLIKHFGLDNSGLRAAQLGKFTKEGISPDRIGLLGSTSRQDHLAAFKEVDISLDPFPHNGGISTLESLQMGVPVIALLGNAVTSRAAGSILASAGLSDWVAENPDAYLGIAERFAAMPARLKALRREIPARIAASAIGNGAIYASAIEAAYRTIWEEYCRTWNGPAAAPGLRARGNRPHSAGASELEDLGSVLQGTPDMRISVNWLPSEDPRLMLLDHLN